MSISKFSGDDNLASLGSRASDGPCALHGPGTVGGPGVETLEDGDPHLDQRDVPHLLQLRRSLWKHRDVLPAETPARKMSLQSMVVYSRLNNTCIYY